MGKEALPHGQNNELTRLTARLNIFHAVLEGTDLQPSLDFYLKNADAIVPFSFELWTKRVLPPGFDYQIIKAEESERIFNRDIHVAQQFQAGITITGENVNGQWKTITIDPQDTREIFLEDLICEEEAKVLALQSRLMK